MEKFETIEAYMAAVPSKHRDVLNDLHARLRHRLAGATELISYAMPGFRLKGKTVAGYASFKAHCSFFPHSGSIVPQFADELKALGFSFTKSGVHFTPEKPLPDNLLDRLVAARLKEAGLV
jgi:uncharacterized protein YdhG (YjbR/CyaY superfamily)